MAKPDRNAPPELPRPSRRRWTAGAVAAAMLALFAGGGYWLWSADQDRRQRQQAIRAAEKPEPAKPPAEARPLAPPTVTWERIYGGTGHTSALSIVLLPDGGIVVAGYTQSKGAGATDAWVFRLDSERRGEKAVR